MSQSQNRKFAPCRTIGILGTITLLVAPMYTGPGGLKIYINLPSIAIVIGITFFLLLASFGKDFLKFIPDCLLTLFTTAEKPNPKFAQIASAGSRYIIAAGLIGTMIGMIQMLVDMSDPDSIGMGMATALLTIIYAVIISEFFFAFLQKAYTDNKAKQPENQNTPRNTAFAAIVVAFIFIFFSINLFIFQLV